jgi:glycosyltransferase involved in cell wall biosynthesis
MTNTKQRPALLAALPFAANTGRAWDRLERLVASISDRLASEGIRTLVAYPEVNGPPAALEGSTAAWVELDARLGSAASLRATAGLVRRENVRVLFLSDLDTHSLYYPLIRLAGVRGIVVQAISSGARTPPRGLKRYAKWLLMRTPFSATRVAAASEFVRDRTVTTTLYPASRITRIWNGVEIPPPDPGAESLTRERFGFSPGTPLVASVNRASPEKGISYLFRAFDRLWSSWGEGGEKPGLIYVGDGPEFRSLQELRDGLASAESILMPGYIPDAISVLAGADVFVSPSAGEDAFPYAVLEPMARGRVVVATDIGGIPEQIEDEVSGLLVPPRDDGALEKALFRSLSDSNLRHRLGEGAKQRVSALFSVENQVEQLCSLILNEVR